MSQPTTAFGNRSVANAAQKVFQLLKRKGTDDVSGLQMGQIVERIGTWDAYFCNYAKWTFRRTSKIVEHWAATTLYAALDTSDAYAELSSNADIPGSGRMSINQDEIDYSDKNTPTSGKSVTISTATGAKTPDVDHGAGEEVRFLVAVPTDFGKPGVIRRGDSLNPSRSKLLHMDFLDSYWPPAGRFFEKDGYLYLPRGLPSGRLHLAYYMKAMKAGQGDDLQTPEQYDNFVIWAAVAESYQVIGNLERAEYFFGKAGFPTVSNPEPVGVLQMAAARDVDQTDSPDELFVPDL